MPVVSIHDIAPGVPEKIVALRPETETEPAVDVKIRGIKNSEVVALAKRFPLLPKLISGAGGDLPRERLLLDFLEMTAALIATGLGLCGDAAVEAMVEDKFSLEEQRVLLEAVLRLSGPPGPTEEEAAEAAAEAARPFAAAAAVVANGSDQPGKASAST